MRLLQRTSAYTFSVLSQRKGKNLIVYHGDKAEGGLNPILDRAIYQDRVREARELRSDLSNEEFNILLETGELFDLPDDDGLLLE